MSAADEKLLRKSEGTFRMKLPLLAVLCLIFSYSAHSAEPDNAEFLYQEAERFYLKSDKESAMKALLKFFSSPTTAQDSRSQVRAHNLKGLIYFQSKSLAAAVQEFESAVHLGTKSLSPTDSILHLARYNLGNALFQTNRSAEAHETLITVNADALDPDTRMRFYHLLGNVLALKDDSLQAVIYYLKAANLAKESGLRDTFIQKAATSSKKLFLRTPKSDVERIAQESFSSSSATGIAANVLMARGYMYMGEQTEAESLLKRVLADSEPDHPLRAKAEEMLGDLGKLTDVNPKTIGVLLPLSGKFARFGRLCLNSINLAAGSFEEMPERLNSSKFRFVIRDSGETIDSALEAFESLVKEEKAIAVLGPLLSKQFPAVARRSQEFGVPLLSLSQRIEAAQTGSFIFPVALSPKQQIDLVVSQAMQVNGYKRFAILAPSDSFGDEYVTLFWDEVEKRGGEIVGIERFPPKATDFRDELKDLLGLDALGARKAEVEDLKRREELYASTLKVKGKLRQRLLKAFDPKPVVDFDAIFIPDDPATVGQIAPSFAVLDIDNLPMLGINTWNTSEIVQRAGSYLQRSLFVDGFFQSSKNPKTIKFVQDYMKYFSSIPGTIEVQTYDAASILLEALNSEGIKSRAKLRDQLLNQEKFTGISGDYRFSVDGVQRGAHLLTVRGNSIIEIPFGQATQE